MIHSVRFKAVLDTNIIFPIVLRDIFLTDIIDLNQETALMAFKEMVFNKRKPEMDEYQVLENLRNNGLVDTANYLHAFL